MFLQIIFITIEHDWGEKVRHILHSYCISHPNPSVCRFKKNDSVISAAYGH